MGYELTKLVLAIIGVLVGFILFKRRMNKSKLIDTESVAVVKDVNLGRVEGRKVYAIKYDVCAGEPFELLETPCKKARKIGTQRSVFYEQEAPNKNYYFKTIGRLDSRLLTPAGLLLASIVVVINITLRMLGA